MNETEPAPSGHFLADNGESIKKCCKSCAYYYHSQEYSNHEIGCEFNGGENGMQFLPTFPFKNGCKYFEPHYIYLVDWDAELKSDELDHTICQHLHRGKCFSHGSDCPHKKPVEHDHPICAKPETKENEYE